MNLNTTQNEVLMTLYENPLVMTAHKTHADADYYENHDYLEANGLLLPYEHGTEGHFEIFRRLSSKGRAYVEKIIELRDK